MIKKKYRNFLAGILSFVFILGIFPLSVFKPYKIEAAGSATATQAGTADLVNEIIGPGITASNISFTGNVAQGAVFNNASFMPFSDGIILSTGNASSVFTTAATLLSTQYGGLGDTDLTSIYQSGGFSDITNDAASLQFTVNPTSNKLSFRYVFASEEYDQSENFNDIFALYVGGKNIALLPNGNTVSIKNTKNTSYYIDNSAGNSIGFLGYTTELSCEATVTPNTPVTIRLVIADAADSSVDSAVFIKADSINFVPASAPILSNVSTTANIGSSLSATSDKSGTLYLVPKGIYSDKAALEAVPSKITAPCNSNISANINTSGLTAGIYQVYAADSLNNISAASPDINLALPDITAPTFSVSGNPTLWTSSNVTLAISASDAVSGLNTTGAYSFDGGSTWTTSNTKSFSTNETVNIKVRDNSGNVSSQNIDITKIDKTAPIITGANNSSSYFIGRVINLSDDIGEIAGATYKNGTDAEASFKDGDLFEYAGNYVLTLMDKAGNSNTISFEIKALPKVSDVVYTSDCKALIDSIRSEFNSHSDLPELYKADVDNQIKALEDRYSELGKKLIVYDAKTDLTVTGIDGTLFTTDVYLVVTPINVDTNETIFSSASKNVENASKYISALEGKELLALYDVSLFRDNIKIQPDGMVKVKIKIPEELRNRTGLDIVHIADNGTVTSMNAVVEGEYLVFTTTHFSDYAIVANSITKEIPKTGSVVDFDSLIIVGILISLLGIVLIRKRIR